LVSTPRFRFHDQRRVLSSKEERGGSVLEKGGVGFDKRLFIFGDIIDCENRIRGAGGNAGTTVDTFRWVDEELSRRFEAGLILFRMDAVGGANVDAERILDTGIGDYVGHDEDLRDEFKLFV
jgi:hypothetical protein